MTKFKTTEFIPFIMTFKKRLQMLTMNNQLFFHIEIRAI